MSTLVLLFIPTHRRSINLKNPKKRKKPKQTCIMPPNELKHHFNRFFGAPVPPKAWGPIFRSFQNFMAKFVGSLKEVQEELNMPINQVVLPATKLLLESYQVLKRQVFKRHGPIRCVKNMPLGFWFFTSREAARSCVSVGSCSMWLVGLLLFLALITSFWSFM